MRITRPSHIPWAIFVVVFTAAASLLYVSLFHPQRLPEGFRFFGQTPLEHATVGGTPLGLIFGTISLGIFLFATLLGLRKRLPFLRIGNIRRWLRAHIWLTLLTVPLILLHSGFHLGGGMTTLLMALYAIVMLSGVYGLILQQKIPTLMKERLPAEIVYEQIPNIQAQLCLAARKLHETYVRGPMKESPAPMALAAAAIPDVSVHAVLKTPSAVEKPMGGATIRGTPVNPAAIVDAERTEADDAVGYDAASEKTLADFIDRQLLPYLEARRGERHRLGKERQAAEIFRHLSLRVAGAYRPRLEEMQGWCDERRLLDVQTRLQHWLHGWLLVHAPLSFLLVIMTVWHAVVTLFKY